MQAVIAYYILIKIAIQGKGDKSVRANVLPVCDNVCSKYQSVLPIQIDKVKLSGNKTVHRQDNSPTRLLKTVHRQI